LTEFAARRRDPTSWPIGNGRDFLGTWDLFPDAPILFERGVHDRVVETVRCRGPAKAAPVSAAAPSQAPFSVGNAGDSRQAVNANKGWRFIGARVHLLTPRI
jgi:hypothetical protein